MRDVLLKQRKERQYKKQQAHRESNKLILKLMEIHMAINSLKKRKNKVGRLTLSDSKVFYKATVIKTEWTVIRPAGKVSCEQNYIIKPLRNKETRQETNS